MTVIATARGLVMYSPVALSPATCSALKQMGTVEAIVAPNLYHHMFLRACCSAFPSAKVLVAPGLQAKIGAIDGAEEISTDTVVSASGEFQHYVFSGHSLRETILFHQPTGSLITADLLYNYGPRQFPAERLFFRSIGCYGSPAVAFYHRFSIRDKSSVRHLINAVTSWPIRRIVMCHGDIIEAENASSLFADAWFRFSD